MEKHPELTQLLQAWGRGDRSAHEELVSAVYGELRRLAAHYLRREHSAQTLQPTALVHEAYLRLAGDRPIDWKNRGHFFALAAQAMRRVLVDHARAQLSQKRGARGPSVTFAEEFVADMPSGAEDPDLLELEEALCALEAVDARLARMVDLRYYAGLSIEETARALEVSPATVKRDWTTAKAWLHARLSARA